MSYFKTKNYTERVGVTDKVLSIAKNQLTARTYGPLLLLAKTVVISLMEKIQLGQLKVITNDRVYTFGTPAISETESIAVEIVVVREIFWIRMLLLSDLGFSEAYMDGDIDIDNLDGLFKVRCREKYCQKFPVLMLVDSR